MDETEQIAAPDALWLAALARDRGRAAVRLADMLPGRDVGEAAVLAARCVHAELDREARIVDRRPGERTADRLRRDEAERRQKLRGWVHPGWAPVLRQVQRHMGKPERIAAVLQRGPGGWDAAATYAMALLLPAVAWGERGGTRKEPGARPHRLGIDGYDVARWLPVSEPRQLWAERPATLDDPEPEAEIVDNAQPPDGVGVQE